jgi:hypothetical protein
VGLNSRSHAGRESGPRRRARDVGTDRCLMSDARIRCPGVGRYGNRRVGLNWFDKRGGGEEAVSAPREGFDKTRIVGGVAESKAQLFHRRIQTVIEGDVGVGWPEFLL